MSADSFLGRSTANARTHLPEGSADVRLLRAVLMERGRREGEETIARRG
ncbi:Hypothetical protein A7982_01944 [Minicystis rosea]|nr:Hypothetical protein A7982_01944 [Minicystis rosea]